MTPEQITTELADCKTADRYLTDVNGDRFWVFGLPTGEILVRRIHAGTMKPLRTMQYSEVVSIEKTPAVESTCDHSELSVATSADMETVCVECGQVVETKNKTVVFEVRYTESTVVVNQSVVGSKMTPREKIFRKGYADRTCKADQWIHTQIESYREMALADGIPIPEFKIAGHKLTVKRPAVSEIISAMKQLMVAIEAITDVTDINSDIGRACERAEYVISRS
jgi:hypothetical protein